MSNLRILYPPPWKQNYPSEPFSFEKKRYICNKRVPIIADYLYSTHGRNYSAFSVAKKITLAEINE